MTLLRFAYKRGEDMIEVLWHGRGGQGAFTAARLLGAAATLSGERYALAFPSFGPERRGAPMRAFTKMSNAPIGDRTAVTCADIVVYLDGTLFAPGWESEVKPGGVCLVNSAEPLEAPAGEGAPRLIAVDASALAQEKLGRPIPNTVFLGLIAGLGTCVSKAEVEEAIKQYMPEKLHAKNIELVEYAAELASGDAEFEFAAAENVDEAAVVQSAYAERPEGTQIPTLRSSVPGPDVYAQDTCFEGGFLTQKNAGWRNVRPVVDTDKCTGCLQCYLYCPDGTIFKREFEAADGKSKHMVALDYDFCKGCGVCASVCKFGAIQMQSETEALAAEAATEAATEEASN